MRETGVPLVGHARSCAGVEPDAALYRRGLVTARHLADRNALDVEDQVRVGGNVRGSTALAVRKSGGDGEATLAAGRHASDTDVPALDDLADTELEGERLALLVGWRIVSCVSVRVEAGYSQSKTLPFFSLPM